MSHRIIEALRQHAHTEFIAKILEKSPKVYYPNSSDELAALAVRDANPDIHEVAYEVPGMGRIVEATVCKARNGIAANYPDPKMRRRDPDCMYIGDMRPTDKKRYRDVFNQDFDILRQETFAWLEQQELICYGFVAGKERYGAYAIILCPANAGFFAFGLSLLQGIIAPDKLPSDFCPRAAVFVAPPFRHTHFKGNQAVVHNRTEHIHEMFSYNLYPGPSAKKGVYSVLLDIGEQEGWLTAHCSTVQITTPYDLVLTIMHEGASGGGKSEMLEAAHRQKDGRLFFGQNLVTGEKRYLSIPQSCQLNPVNDDMALCHPAFQDNSGKLRLCDAEDAWFLRVDHIKRYGTDPDTEALTINTPVPLLFLNIAVAPNSTALIWEHIEDKPGVPCPNPRVVVPRHIVPDVISEPVTIDIRSFGFRAAPCTREKPSYGIVGLFHILPPALAWIWRLVAPRGHANPSILETEGLKAEGVGSYWPFATGRRVDQANLLLKQILTYHKTQYILVPNQHIGAWKVGFMPQWITREYLARRGSARFPADKLRPARCPLLGYALTSMTVEGQVLDTCFFHVEKQPEVGGEAYDIGAKMLTNFFKSELKQFLVPDLHPLGRKIIECCLSDGSVSDYEYVINESSNSMPEGV